ncbi:hypothetical protein [Halomarina litorea]|uniref:hypothetical protein n=1 Tax=Halomarina litorea TaxID=2961595 RepID=UPI0020C2B3EF|nr:hypothetical protein [Halomarina sp. BCD28]
MPAAPVGGLSSEDGTIEREFTSEFGIEYVATLDTETHVLEVHARNPTDGHLEASSIVSVDGKREFEIESRLRPSETWSKSIKLRSSLDALRSNHSVAISTYGAHETFDFEYTVDPESPHGVAIPRITDVSVGTAQIDGEPSSVVNVTIANPSIQTYPTKLMVHTRGTDGSFYAAVVPPGESETITVELLDARDATIAGEARLYAGDFDEREGGLDQVGFVGRAGEETAQWNESFEPVAAPWSDDPYQYVNASVDDGQSIADRASGGHDVGGVPVVYPILALVGVALLATRLR